MKRLRTLTCALAAASLLAGTVRAQDAVRLHGHVLDVLPQAVHLTRNPQHAQEAINLTVMLNLSDPDGFKSYRQGFENPASPTYRKRLSPSDFNSRFGPTQKAYDAVLAWLQQNGFTLTEGSDNRLTLTVSGTRAQAERAFAVTIDDYLMGSRQFHAIDTDPAIPSALAPFVRSVTGFSDLAQHRPAMSPQAVEQAYNGFLTVANVLVGTGAGVLPPGINGAGQTIALLEYDSFNPSDVSYWLSTVGLPATLIKQVSTIQVNNGTSPSGCQIQNAGCGEGEVLLDINAALTIAPGAKVAVMVTKQSTSDLALVNGAVNYLNKGPAGGGVISDSWSTCEPENSSSDNDSMDTLLETIAIYGQTFFTAAGDTGSTCVSPQGTWANAVAYPANAPHAIAVGGTTLQPAANGSYGTETWWQNAGGFGVSKSFARPSYQNAYTAASGRSVPDVAMEAGNGIPVCQNSQCIPIGGTSLATPLWAGVWALASQAQSLAQGQVGGAQGAYGGYYYGVAPLLHAAPSMTGTGNDFAHLGMGSPNIPSVVSWLAGAPVVSAISPASGPITGGTTVLITGHAFIGVSSVLFGSTPATSFTVDAESQIKAVSPPCLGGKACSSVGITVNTPAGSVGTSSANDFAYEPVISSVSPSSGPMTGGTVVTITGQGFSSIGYNLPFSFGTVAAVNAQCSSSTQCTMASPAHAAGAVSVTYPGSVALGSDQFTYDGPTITSISPNVGSQAGGTTVFIIGTVLSQNMTVKFGSVTVPVQSCDSDTWCTVFSPAGKGAVNVSVTSGGLTSAQTPADVFTYEPFPYGTMSPNSGTYLGGTNVTVTGANFSTAAGGTQFSISTGFGVVAIANVKCTSTTVCTMTMPPAQVSGSAPEVQVSATVGNLTSVIGDFTYTGFPTTPAPTPAPVKGKTPPCKGTICQ